MSKIETVLPQFKVKYVALAKLTPSKDNVRKHYSKESVEQLANSIQANGLLQNLVVQDGKNDTVEVTAGGRRLRALQLLAKRGVIKKDHPVACQSRDVERATEVSLTENFQREAMHPADEIEAFGRLFREGRSPEEIGDRLGVSPVTVRRRLKLACISPKIMKLFREGEASLEQLQALALTEDQALQEQVFLDVEAWERRPEQIRKRLSQNGFAATSKIARFLGVEAYERAGGAVLRDLFDDRNSGYLTDTELVIQMADAKLQETAKAFEGQGWKWVMISREDQFWDYGHVTPDVSYSKRDQKRADKLNARLVALHAAAEIEDADLGDEIEEVEHLVAELEEANLVFSPEQKAGSGVAVTIDHQGQVTVRQGLVAPEDRKSAQREQRVLEKKESGGAEAASAEILSRAVIEDLSKLRTAGLAVTLADNAPVALRVVAYHLACEHLLARQVMQGSVLVRATRPNLTPSQVDEENTLAFAELQSRKQAMITRLPSDRQGLWDWLLEHSAEQVQQVIALCTALSLDAVESSGQPHDKRKLAEVGLFAKALGFSMKDWFRPSVSYFKRVSKAVAKKALTDCNIDPQRGVSLEKAKKVDAAKIAADALAASSWVPAVIAGFPNMESCETDAAPEEMIDDSEDAAEDEEDFVEPA